MNRSSIRLFNFSVLPKFFSAAFLASTIFVSANAFAITPIRLTQEGPSLTRFFGVTLDKTYRIGDEWGKKVVTPDDLNSDANFRRMALATGHVGGATGFYLGEFNGHHLMATNHHVCETAGACMGATVNFPLLNVRAEIVDFFGSWTDVDLAIFEISLTAKDIQLLAPVASPFALNSHVYRGEPLVTIGFGIGGGNRIQRLVGNRDSDCKVFSGEGEYRFMADPDDLNPGPYKAWSFANGCDVSHGDSGSAMMDRVTGQVVGIIWTGRIPKNSKVQSSKFLDELINSPGEDIWRELSYSVPADKIKDFLVEKNQSGGFTGDQAKTIQQMIDSSH